MNKLDGGDIVHALEADCSVLASTVSVNVPRIFPVVIPWRGAVKATELLRRL